MVNTCSSLLLFITFGTPKPTLFRLHFKPASYAKYPPSQTTSDIPFTLALRLENKHSSEWHDKITKKTQENNHNDRLSQILWAHHVHLSKFLTTFAQITYKKSLYMMIFHPININQYPGIDLPKRMNNPLDYTPHPLCIAVCKELQDYLAKRDDWREEIDKGKMFGILLVERNINGNSVDTRPQQEIGYLAAYSGQIGGRSDWEDFVPAVFDYLQPNGYFKTHESEITEINHAIARLSQDERMKKAHQLILSLQKKRQQTICRYQEKMKEAKAKRDARRLAAQQAPDTQGLSQKEEQEMIKESQFMKAELRRLKKALAEKTELEIEYDDFLDNLQKMKQLRKTLSDALQQWLFMQFRMLNHQGESKDLLEIFKDTTALVPPAGSGECCEPKLLQYAYQHGYKPLQMSMFWWGKSPKEEIRHHLQYYPACNGKCKPILHWMLPESCFAPSSTDNRLYNKIEILYDDRELAVIHKPESLLSVPGKDTQQLSVYSWARKQFPEAEGPLIVHRLDMATSGLLIIAKKEFAYHQLQQAFLHHQVQKKYIAIICAKDKETFERILFQASRGENHRGIISLPLMPDYLDRPRQMVSHENGKEAITEYEIVREEREGKGEGFHLRLALYPKTGRTHQLRVHCAHHEGLNAPILGDPLYGNENADRLYLHAEAIRFKHPLTGKELFFERKASF